jgi:Plants and Prokaryotes Conserved (PCC) domain
MQHKLLHEAGGQRTFVVVLETGEEIVASLQQFAERENVHTASFTAIGALSDAVLLYFDWQKKAYQKIPVGEQVEVASLIGTSPTIRRASPPCISILSSAPAMAAPKLGTSAKAVSGPRWKSW